MFSDIRKYHELPSPSMSTFRNSICNNELTEPKRPRIKPLEPSIHACEPRGSYYFMQCSPCQKLKLQMQQWQCCQCSACIVSSVGSNFSPALAQLSSSTTSEKSRYDNTLPSVRTKFPEFFPKFSPLAQVPLQANRSPSDYAPIFTSSSSTTSTPPLTASLCNGLFSPVSLSADDRETPDRAFYPPSPSERILQTSPLFNPHGLNTLTQSALTPPDPAHHESPFWLLQPFTLSPLFFR
ncbi:uncharacterized protein VTP21DRAFT_5380 [Calcarisporiella thermophila]|uniref:uncharacterized protein n=1 Tax=Calcarisporiella thermophila TaxID=911321 RepID=UPI003743D853